MFINRRKANESRQHETIACVPFLFVP